MSLRRQQQRVERHERLLEGRLQQAHERLGALQSDWRASWTPGRIVIAGLAAGFLLGRAKPARLLHRLGGLGGLGGSRWLQLLGPLSSLYAALQSGLAAAAAAAAKPVPAPTPPADAAADTSPE